MLLIDDISSLRVLLIIILILLSITLITTGVIIALMIKNKKSSNNDHQFTDRIANIVTSNITSFSTMTKDIFDSNFKLIDVKQTSNSDILNNTINSLKETITQLTTNVEKNINDLNEKNEIKQNNLSDALSKAIINFKENITLMTSIIDKNLKELTERTEKAINALQNENKEKLNEMKMIVDEKLQKTLEERISKSFENVSHQLENVYKAVGEMQSIAKDVGSLQKVLTNVKTKGIVGEIQLGAILSEILTKDQYEENVVTKKGSHDPVEFAIKLPGDNANSIYLPIDSKLPLKPYQDLLDSYESGDKEAVISCSKILRSNVLTFAKDISSKYISVPDTTDFAIMFLPIEGLYAEVIKLGLVEELQAKYKINVAGPSTMAALLNALQMGFKTLAIQKRSGEVWRVLGAVKTEFANFETTLQTAQERLNKTQEELEKLVGVKTRKINSKLRSIEFLPFEEATKVLNNEE